MPGLGTGHVEVGIRLGVLLSDTQLRVLPWTVPPPTRNAHRTGFRVRVLMCGVGTSFFE